MVLFPSDLVLIRNNFVNNFLDYAAFPFTELKRDINGCNLNKKQQQQTLNNKNLNILNRCQGAFINRKF